MRIEANNDNDAFPISMRMNLAPGFEGKCKEVFAECTSLVEEIEAKKLRSRDLREIVKQFNSCIE
jgi:hypothetical protein